MFTKFPPNSRYHRTETAVLQTPDGEVIYLRRRFLPHPSRFSLLQYHTVTQGERLDHIAAEYIGDAVQFWRIADANNAMKPDDLTAEPGRKLRITMPEGVPGPGIDDDA